MDLAADGVEYQIASAHHLGEIATCVVDDLASAHGTDEFVVSLASGGNHFGAPVLCILDRKMPEAAGATVYQNFLAARDRSCVLECRDPRHPGGSQRRCSGVIERIDRDGFGMSALAHCIGNAEDLIVDSDTLDILAHRPDDAREVAPQHVGQCDIEIFAHQPRPHLPIDRIDAGRCDGHQDFRRGRFGSRNIGQRHDLGAAIFVKLDRFHRDPQASQAMGPAAASAGISRLAKRQMICKYTI